MSDLDFSQEHSAPQQRINLADADDVKCDKCGDTRFEPVYLIKKLSKIVSPTGKDELIPLGPPIVPPIFACYSCGWINDIFVPGPLKSMRPDSSTNHGMVASDLSQVGTPPKLTLI